MTRWKAGGLVLGLLALGLVAGLVSRGAGTETALAQGARTWDVQIGASEMDSGAETQAYFPNVLTINAGDTVRWNWASFHTVTFLAGPPPSLIGPGPGPGELQIGPAFFPIPPGPTAPTGPYDGRSTISSGTPQGDPADEPPFVLTLTSVGTYTYVCLIHLGMQGAVTVLPAGAATPETPQQATARGQAEAQSAIGLINSVAQGVQSAPSAGSAGSATVSVGLTVPAAGSKLAMLPGNVNVRRGGSVTFYMADTYEIHTVTFTSGAMPPEFIEPVDNPMGPPTLIVRANVAGPTGGTTYTGQGYLNSGILTGGQAYSIAFDAPPGAYEYLCLVHPFMKGTVTVTP